MAASVSLFEVARSLLPLLLFSLAFANSFIRLSSLAPVPSFPAHMFGVDLSVTPALLVDHPFWARNKHRATALVAQVHHVIKFQGVRFFVPFFPRDFIQHHQVSSGCFFENDILLDLAQYIPPGSVVFDIGANIGNHAVFWAVKGHAQKVYCFEPVPSTYAILKRNVALNQLEDRIIALNLALSDQIEGLEIASYSLSNIGARI
jgi:hypothetical protein